MAGARRSLHVVSLDTLASRLRNRREADDLTQAELAVRIGVRQQTIGACERGDRPQTRFMTPLAQYLELSVDEVAELALTSSGPQVPSASSSAHTEPTPEHVVNQLASSLAARMAQGPLSTAETELFREVFTFYRERTKDAE